jgi:NADH-quinone oxidoreductase subunit L
MEQCINILILIPLIGFLISLLIPKQNEKVLSSLAFGVVGIHLVGIVLFSIIWLFSGHQTWNIKDIVLYESNDYSFFIDFCFDKIVMVYAIVGAFLTFVVALYSRSYMHRENGYKRFFNTILFFYLGYIITIFSGNFETLFIGWEILGISSFLLIAFYRDRYLPVKNAVKVFSIYRLGDVGILLAMWMSHHLWHQNITFLQLSNSELVHEHLQQHTLIGVLISIMILITASAKSAQLPFTSWLPRAMEGPTPSSAIFYGSLSVHLGVFLLLRTFPYWQEQTSVRIIIVALGLFTSIISTGIARVQSSIKSQIAYASAAQIGIIFIELAFGWDWLALFHFASNAFLRTYQLLVSPSIVSYLIKDQLYNFLPNTNQPYSFIPTKWRNTFYMLSLKEWNLGDFVRNIYWHPIKWFGAKLKFLSMKNVLLFFIPIYVIGIVLMYDVVFIPQWLHSVLPCVFAAFGLAMVMRSFIERKNPYLSFLLVALNHFWIALAISFNEHYNFNETVLYMGGIIAASTIGILALRRLQTLEGSLNLQLFSGHSYEHPKIAFMFLLACLGLAGFPITTAFIGEDLIFSHIHENQVVLAFLVSLGFVIDGLALIRLYARLFLGTHLKSYHERAYRSS